MAPRVVIVGAPGAGKSTVGALLAARWGCAFHDTDSGVEVEAGMPVSQVFITQGEAHFRELERAVVARTLAEEHGVVALGGGAIMDEGTRALLRQVPVVWLEVGLSDALSRVGMNQARPLLLGNVRGTMLRMLQERTPLYAEVATVRVPTDGRDPADIVADITAQLPSPPPPPPAPPTPDAGPAT